MFGCVLAGVTEEQFKNSYPASGNGGSSLQVLAKSRI
jgi:hypothetical protein